MAHKIANKISPAPRWDNNIMNNGMRFLTPLVWGFEMTERVAGEFKIVNGIENNIIAIVASSGMIWYFKSAKKITIKEEIKTSKLPVIPKKRSD